MKKIIILLISLTLIVSCLVIGASAKLFTPPTQATDCIVFNEQDIAYPYYTLSQMLYVGSNVIYPTLLAVYNTDSFTFYFDSAYTLVLFVSRTSNGINIQIHDQTQMRPGDMITTIYDGEGYDVLFYYYDEQVDASAAFSIVDENYNVIVSYNDSTLNLNNYKVTVSQAESQGKTIGYGVADEPPETEPPETEAPETEAPETETPVVPPVIPSEPGEGGHITEVITDGIIPFVSGLGSAFVLAFTSLFIYEGNINVLGIFILTMFGIAVGYGVIRWITHIFRKE